MAFIIAPPPVVSLSVDGTDDRFAVRRIYCVGRNYAAHSREMGHDPDREEPFFFSKPADALVADGSTIPYPKATRDLHHEIELVAAIGAEASDIDPSQALACVWGYAVGIDLTRRDIQAEAKKAGRPWEMAKGFDQSAPCGALQPASRVGHPAKGAIRLRVNGEVRQDADLGAMIWSVAETIAALSRLIVVKPGDLIFTGTPEGVGPVRRGDRLEGEVAGVGTVTVTVA